MSETVISISNVSKYYKLYRQPKDRLKEALHPFKKKYHKPHYALEGLSLEIQKGDILGVVGRNGCGKSTLLKLITGVLQPNEGTVSVKGKITALLELGAGFNPEFTGIDNIKFYGKILGLEDTEVEKKLPSIIEFAELSDYLYQPVKTYSSGMRSRLGFSVAVHVEPEILILDEVLAVGDSFFRHKCYAKMEEFFKAGKTVIYVSHDAQSVVQLCNRAILLHEGRVLEYGEPKDVIDSYNALGVKRAPVAQGESVVPVSCDDLKVTSFPQPSPKILGGESIMASCFELRGSDGAVVNNLKCGDDYMFSFDVTAAKPECSVRFAFIIKDSKGVALGGAKILDIDSLLPGNKLSIEKSFYCNYAPGYYFITVTVLTRAQGEPVILTRVVDALAFKIDSWPEDGYWGLTYLASRTKVC